MSGTGSSGVDNDKSFKICSVLNGLDITRFVSSNTRNFFRGAIDDVELIREFVSTSAENQGIVGGVSTLAELNQTLDWVNRGFDSPTTTVEAGLGYVDDRIERTIERFVSYSNEPLVGDKETDMAILNAVSLIFPWIVDRKSNEAAWWVSHQNGRSEGATHEPFLFERLYTAAFIGTYGEAWAYYPPLTVYGHPLTGADVLTSEYDSHEEEFVKPNLPENNPERRSFFSQPYADTAVPGLSLITALAPVYFNGTFGDYTYDDTYLASAGLDISVSSVSTLLDKLEGTLTKRSFGVLVDSSFNTIVISQSSVGKLYPERTGFEEFRVTYNLATGDIVQDRRNVTYEVSDTILEPLPKLQNADWNALLARIKGFAPGSRDFTTLDVTLTGDEDPTEFYIMFERWQYVADWTLLVFAPTQETDFAVDVHLLGESGTGLVQSISLEAEKGTPVQGSSLIVNSGTLDITFIPKNLPHWIQLATISEGEQVVLAGESLPIEFNVLSDDLEFGTTSGVMTFTIQDDQYPDCFYNGALSLEVVMKTTAQDCGPARVADANNNCVCASNAAPIGGNCVLLSVLLPSILVPLVVVALFALYVYVERKRKQADSVWAVKPTEIHFADPPEIIGRGTFGLVLAAEYRGTRVAVKRVLPPRSQGGGRSGSSGRLGSSEQRTQSGNHETVISKEDQVTPMDSGSVKDSGSLASGLEQSNEALSKSVDPPSSKRPQRRKSAIQTEIFNFENDSDKDNTKTDINVSGFTKQASGLSRQSSAHSKQSMLYGGNGIVEPAPRNTKRRKSETQAQLDGVEDLTGDRETDGAEQTVPNDSSLVIPLGTDMTKSGSIIIQSAEGPKQMRSFWKRKKRSGENYAKLRSDFIREMRLLSKLRHPCITTVMGAVISSKEEPMLVMEYMDYGSLYDVLHNETMIIEGELVLPILRDVANGLRFLHKAEPQVIHGDLKAQNVLVDIKFRAKVADFGLSQKQKVGATGTPFWMAPELLRGESTNTADSDVYSFGIILYEVYSRKEPYEGEDIQQVLRDICDPTINRRPPVPSSMPPSIVSLMCDCLVTDPKSRPTFDEIDSRLKRLSVENIEPADNQYSSAKDREAKKNEELLHKVFPKHIAEALREGRKVEPEHYDCVTIFFSDIVGFTDISGASTPLKIADMLDRLYLAFDWLSDEHGVFKIETIGDAWVGVTNLVEDQADHAERVALFAIDAIEAASKTLIDLEHPEKGCIHIRVGFHSGPVLSNVVGSRNPKFSIFGDTVNTASRMESNSSSGKILCSETSAELMKQTGTDLHVNLRGDIDVKGKGQMKTFWVSAPRRLSMT